MKTSFFYPENIPIPLWQECLLFWAFLTTWFLFVWIWTLVEVWDNINYFWNPGNIIFLKSSPETFWSTPSPAHTLYSDLSASILIVSTPLTDNPLIDNLLTDSSPLIDNHLKIAVCVWCKRFLGFVYILSPFFLNRQF